MTLAPASAASDPLRLALPKGRMADNVTRLLGDAGVGVRATARGYRPALALAGVDTKILKPQNIIEMLHRGTRDVGFAGADWAAEKGAELVEVLDTGLDPVRIVAAAPTELVVDGALPTSLAGRPLLVATEYVRLTEAWIAREGLQAEIVRSYGATEVFPPEDADAIVDNTATGATLVANGLQIVGELMRSSTRLYAHPAAMDVPHKRDRIEHLALLLRSVLEARRRVMVEVNCQPADLEAVVRVLPCMREPTVAPLHGGAGYAVKAAVPRDLLAELVPVLKAAGATDLVVTRLDQIVP
jgi:ATP phosphoribosyltransferase